MSRFLVAVVASFSFAAHADEGMWLINELPTSAIEKTTGAKLDTAFVSRVQRGALRLANGCSASFVGASGLVMTNHHCIRSCLEELSVGGKDYLGKPFVAKTGKDELRCTRFELNQLQEIKDVTDQVLRATSGKSGAAFNDALKAEKSRIESACAGGDATVRCEIVTLFDGAKFHLYKQRRFQDVRVVFAPEFAMAAYGGDPDNFNFPRTAFDVAFVRVWQGEAPLSTTDVLPFAATSAKDGDAAFVVGHPGGTERSRTVAQLAFQRDVALPWHLQRLAEQRGRLDEWMKAVPARLVRGKARLRSVENGLKALRGRHEALTALGFMDARLAAENELKKGAGPVSLQAFTSIDEANRAAARLWPDYRLLEGAEAFGGDLFAMARLIARAQVEGKKPDAERLPEFTSARIAQARQLVASTSPIVIEDDVALLSWSLHRLRNLKGIDDPLVKHVLGTRSPESVAKATLLMTKLKDPKLRAAAFDGDAKALAAIDKDPLYRLALTVDAASRAARKAWEDEVDAQETKAGELLSALRKSKPNATSTYPDATFSLRLSFGKLAGTKAHSSQTTLSDLFTRSGAEAPFLLPPSWKAGQSKLDLLTPMNVSTTNDIIGGNSGSPLLNAGGEVIGLVFDGNLPSLGGRYTYDADNNRAVAVHHDAILAALRHVYGAPHVVAEIEAARRSR